MAWQNLDSNTANFDNDISGQTKSFWLPEIYSKNVQIAFRKASVCQAITNTDYFGEIAQFGDTVNIIKEPQITVAAYLRGATALNGASNYMTDQELVLQIDQANAFEFFVDDLEERFSHVSWQSLASDNAGYKLSDAMDVEVLAHMLSGVTAGLTLGADAAATGGTDVDPAGSIDMAPDGLGADPVNVMARAARLLDENNIPSQDRWFLARPDFYEVLAKSDSKLMSTDYNAGMGSLRNGLVQDGMVRGFTMYTTNNMPNPTTADVELFMFGHKSAVATAEALTKMETLRSTTSFRDIVRGLHVYGRGVLRDDAFGVGYYDPT
jgi:hypothetical protein